MLTLKLILLIMLLFFIRKVTALHFLSFQTMRPKRNCKTGCKKILNNLLHYMRLECDIICFMSNEQTTGVSNKNKFSIILVLQQTNFTFT